MTMRNLVPVATSSPRNGVRMAASPADSALATSTNNITASGTSHEPSAPATKVRTL
jgi:hypothetical protein